MLGYKNKSSENHSEVQETTGRPNWIPYLCNVITNPIYSQFKQIRL